MREAGGMLTPDDPLPDLEEWLAMLHAMGPMEYDPGERERIEQALAEMDRLSKLDLERLVRSLQHDPDRQRGD